MIYIVIIIGVILLGSILMAINHKPFPDHFAPGQDVKTIHEDLTPFTHYEELELTGVHVHENKYYIINYVGERNPLTFEHEPNNEYDPNAIKVLAESAHIGYVASCDTDYVSKIIKKKHFALTGVVDRNPDWLHVTYKIYFNENDHPEDVLNYYD
ncbi:HIRAN domain-containing protein [Sediminibacter sp. Hel_I_10]|uniref:HIRAN domain-containing protein n=1 Tax=Sediminibacter sp. Hel_I_10 TaxID=1392490 RepID=UPI00047BB4BE|nr:HIRAN domain-containing protein [Sediminibacter sp. Hel_I_10]